MLCVLIIFSIKWNNVISLETVDIENVGYDVYLLNQSTIYRDIPSDCKLFGTDLSGVVSKNITINFTTGENFWIGAKVGFKRNLNPLGVRNRCDENRTDGITLDQCSNECDTKYFYHNPKSCFCETGITDKGKLFTARACPKEENGLCITRKCILYEKDIEDRSFVCGTFEYFKKPGFWAYSVDDCNKEFNNLCNIKLQSHRKTTWHVAQHYCVEQNSQLLRSEADFLQDYTNETKKYWIALFRQQTTVWGSGGDDSICIAARVNERQILETFTTFCNQSLYSLCLRQNIGKEKQETAEDASLKGVT